MMKLWYKMTPEDKQRFYEGVITDYEKSTGLPWSIMEMKIRENLDSTFDDARFAAMSPDDQIDARYCRKEFGKLCIRQIDKLW